MQKFDTYNIQGATPSTEMPIYPTKGGFITLDQPVGTIFFQLMCANPGSIIVEGKDGEYLYYPAVAAGQLIVTCGVAVISAATIDGQAVTTTASNIWWFGGK